MSDDTLQSITKGTLLPLGLVISIATLTWIAAGRITGVEARTDNNTETIRTIQVDRAESKKVYIDHLIKIEAGMAEMNAKLELLLKGHR